MRDKKYKSTLRYALSALAVILIAGDARAANTRYFEKRNLSHIDQRSVERRNQIFESIELTRPEEAEGGIVEEIYTSSKKEISPAVYYQGSISEPGPVSVHFDSSLEYTRVTESNFRGLRNDPEPETVRTYTPELEYVIGARDLISAGYISVPVHNYENLGLNDKNDFIWSQFFEKRYGKLSVTSDYTMNVHHGFSDDPDDKPSRFRGNRISVDLNYEINPKLSLAGGYDYSDLFSFNETQKSGNSRTREGWLRFVYDSATRSQGVKIFFEHTQSFYNPLKLDRDDSYDGRSYMIGMTKRIFPKTTLSVTSGINIRDFNNARERIIGAKEDLILSASLYYALTQKSGIHASFDMSSYTASPIKGPNDADSYNMGVEFLTRLSPKIRFVGKQSLTVTKDKMITTATRLDHPLITVTGRDKALYTVSSASLVYTPDRHANLGLTYAFNRTINNFDTHSHHNHILEGFVTYDF